MGVYVWNWQIGMVFLLQVTDRRKICSEYIAHKKSVKDCSAVIILANPEKLTVLFLKWKLNTINQCWTNTSNTFLNNV